MMRIANLTIFLSLVVFSLLFFLPASAQQPTPTIPTDDQVNAIASQMFCPVCENIPLDVCPTQACIEWRELIREKLALGWDEDQIKDYFVEQFGDRVLAAPPARGLNWLVYIIPPIAFVGGAFILFRAMRSFQRSETSSGTELEIAKFETRDEYVARLEEELREQ